MTREQWEKVKELLQVAIQLAPHERGHFLDENCDAPELRDEVESLLIGENQHTQELFSLETIAVSDGIQESYSWVGRRLGAYKILEKIGEGGMGTVYRAIRADEQFEKDVAIKIAKQGLGDTIALTRFRAERQILAGLDHPNIARLIDAGTTESGFPYFVMELVQGRPIDEYCEDQSLSVDEKLRLFATVCRAVQYAHQHLIVHRDLKPGNILVSKNGVPKLLDFGIAKILDHSIFHGIAPEDTFSFMRILTPQYASPEQISGTAVTTASDVYSLGVILFLLLTGSSPYGSTHSTESLPDVICHTDAPRPSAILRKLQNQGSLDTKRMKALMHRLQGDLDNIVSTALRKEPEGRYQSAEQFADDIRRHLEHLPVLARKSTVVYRCRKYVLRHKVGVAAAALVLISLLAGIVVTTREARIARANELRAERRFNDVRKLANSLMFEINDSIRQSGATAGRKLIIQRAQEYLGARPRIED